jgi:hypothetical protein
VRTILARRLNWRRRRAVERRERGRRNVEEHGVIWLTQQCDSYQVLEIKNIDSTGEEGKQKE